MVSSVLLSKMLKYLDQYIVFCITDVRILRSQDDFSLDVLGLFTIHNFLVDFNNWHWDCLNLKISSGLRSRSGFIPLQ